jgi:predicted DCC family thiol-disulfide oxidoreductase YuxK
VLRVAAGLGAPWSWLRVLGCVPRARRDAVYDFIARRRARISPPAHRRGRTPDRR